MVLSNVLYNPNHGYSKVCLASFTRAYSCSRVLDALMSATTIIALSEWLWMDCTHNKVVVDGLYSVSCISGGLRTAIPVQFL